MRSLEQTSEVVDSFKKLWTNTVTSRGVQLISE